MKLKCVGGKCDGMIVDVKDSQYRQGEGVRVPNFPTRITEDFDFNNPPEYITGTYEIYIIDVLRYQHGKNKDDCSEIWFLRPTNFTAFDAIRFQFNKV